MDFSSAWANTDVWSTTDQVVRPEIGVRSAIVHDWFQGFHGAERVVDVMRSGLFKEGYEPDIFTFHAVPELLPPGLASAIKRESRIGRIPGIRQRGHHPGRWRYLLPYMSRYFERLRLDDYDLVIASSHSCAIHARPRSDAVYACYCYTPIRYAWMPQIDGRRLQGPAGLALRLLARRLRRMDAEAATRPDGYAAISTAVRERIRRFYGRDAAVIHPPVDVEAFRVGVDRDAEHFLWVHRFVSYKYPQVVAEAFRGLPYRLTMVGVGPLAETVRNAAPPNVEVRGWVERDELAGLFERAGGFIHIGEEDFGISMVEALAAGTPVIALDRGGARDIVRHGDDGLLIERPDVPLVRRAIKTLLATTWQGEELAARARCFSRERFLDEMTAFLERLMAEKRA